MNTEPFDTIDARLQMDGWLIELSEYIYSDRIHSGFFALIERIRYIPFENDGRYVEVDRCPVCNSAKRYDFSHHDTD